MPPTRPAPPPALVARLLAAARAVRERAYAPYSRYPVGAAVLAGGEVFAGCNVENASFGASLCAERAAVVQAVSAGQRRIEGIAVATGREPAGYPCGMCRQVLHELGPDIWVAVAGASGEARVLWLAELFPHPFGARDVMPA